MTRTLSTLTALFLGFAFLMLANGLLSTLLALRMGIEEFAFGQIGLVMSAYAVGYILGPFVVPRWIHRIGHIRFFTALAALAAIMALSHPLLPAPLVWMGLRAITGFALASLFMVIESWLNHRTESEARGRVLSVYMIVNYLSFGGGQFLLTLAPPEGFELFCLTAILFCLALIPIALTRAGEPERPEPHVPRFGQMWRLSPLGCASAFSAGLIGMAFNATGPLFAQQSGLPTNEVATFMGLAILAGLLLQWPTGWLSDRVDRRRLIAMVGAGISVTAVLLVVVAAMAPSWLIAAAVLYGGVVYTLYPLAVAHANDVVSPSQSVEMAAGLIFAFGIGAIFGPLIATEMMRLIGPSGLFIMIAAMGLLLSAFAVWRTMRTTPVPVEEKGTFVPMAQSTPAALELDPRVEQQLPPEGAVPAQAEEVNRP